MFLPPESKSCKMLILRVPSTFWIGKSSNFILFVKNNNKMRQDSVCTYYNAQAMCWYIGINSIGKINADTKSELEWKRFGKEKRHCGAWLRSEILKKRIKRSNNLIVVVFVDFWYIFFLLLKCYPEIKCASYINKMR